ncbi:MAG TPA: VCBS repeat-containing protein, partial [Candidatus Acidoferrales bacterium]|nr:VCBS repeat-containing protein [Candidatus Acidoferrales bacterium]
GDFDNDGRNDLLLTGENAPLRNPATQIWRNTGSDFASNNVVLPGIESGSVAWGDYDNDGRLDFVLTGYDYDIDDDIAQIWHNNGDGTFSNVTAVVAPGLPEVVASSVAWGDYDNDGRLDLLLAGTTNSVTSGAICQVWHNTGSGFTNLNAGLPGILLGTVAWGDYDNDGRLDILLAGTTNEYASGAIAQVWRNTGGGFTNLNLGLPGVYASHDYGNAAAFGDYNNDGRLDILLTGTTADGSGLCEIWVNNEPATNTVPTAPTGLAATAVNGEMQLRWNPAADAQTPSAGLSYNVRVGTAPRGNEVVSPEANDDGFRLLPALGNAQMRTNAILDLPPGTYYWSVQAVDTSFAGGPFAPETNFTVTAPTLSIVSSNSDVVISWQPSYPGVVLQESPGLNPAAWTNSPSGATNPITIPVANETMFYRLFKP